MTKTMAISFWPSKDGEDESMLELGGIYIPRIKYTRFLGVYLDEHLNWTYHVNQVHNKIQNKKQMLNLMKHYLSKDTLKKITVLTFIAI